MFNMVNQLTKKDVLEVLKELIIEHDHNRLGTRYEDVHLPDTLKGDLGYDSLDVVELSMATESKFNIRIEDEEVERFWMKATVEELTNFIFQRWQEEKLITHNL